MELTDVFITVTTVYRIQVREKSETDAKLAAKNIYETTDPADLECAIDDQTVEIVVENP